MVRLLHQRQVGEELAIVLAISSESVNGEITNAKRSEVLEEVCAL